MFKPVPTPWREYRHRNIVATVGLLLGLPLITLIAIAYKLWSPNHAEYLFIFLIVVWATLWGWSAFGVVRWPCPKYGVARLANQEPELGSELQQEDHGHTAA